VNHMLSTGVTVALICAVLVVPSLATGSVYTNWPVKPIRRDENPEKYWFVVGLWMAVGGLGLCAAIAGLLLQAGL